MTTGSRVPLGKARPQSCFFECGPLGLSETRSQGLGEVLLDSPAGILRAAGEAAALPGSPLEGRAQDHAHGLQSHPPTACSALLRLR